MMTSPTFGLSARLRQNELPPLEVKEHSRPPAGEPSGTQIQKTTDLPGDGANTSEDDVSVYPADDDVTGPTTLKELHEIQQEYANSKEEDSGPKRLPELFPEDFFEE